MGARGIDPSSPQLDALAAFYILFLCESKGRTATPVRTVSYTCACLSYTVIPIRLLACVWSLTPFGTEFDPSRAPVGGKQAAL